MATINLSDVIKLIPDSKLNWSSDYIDDAEFDVETSLQNLLAEPIDFPGLDQALLKEDVICIPVEPGIPSMEAIVRKTIVELCEIGVSASNITVLLCEGISPSVVQNLVDSLTEANLADCQVIVHDSTSKESIGFLGPNRAGDPITLNARLVHADFVLPIGRFQFGGWKSQSEFLYPYFSDVESQKRFFKLNERHRIESNAEVNKWLGTCFRIVSALRFNLANCESTHSQLPQGQPRLNGTVLSGEPSAVKVELDKRFASQNLSHEETRYDLVMAQANSQTCLSIEEFKQTLSDLGEKCESGGTVVMLMDDAVEIPRFVDEKEATDDFENDFGAFTCFVSSSQKKLNGLGLARINDISEIQRLVDQHDSILVVGDLINEHHLHSNLKTSQT